MGVINAMGLKKFGDSRQAWGEPILSSQWLFL